MNSSADTKQAYSVGVNGCTWWTHRRMRYSQYLHWIWNGLRERAPTQPSRWSYAACRPLPTAVMYTNLFDQEE
ncbi:hypothetical protein [Paenibacillus sp. FSL R7-0652]|uniref:Uncharacterized protein n=1 Tax=Paenibacillus sp. AN1007 TaxID=3151385 RepID=A0AAU8NIM6_9BACL